MNIVKAKKRVLACACSHGEYVNETAQAEFLAFKKDFNPDIVIHLGDFIDTSAWRRGAKGTSDGSRDVARDVEAGFEFLEEIEPNIVALGNHDNRPYDFVNDPDARIRDAAQRLVKDIETRLADLRTRVFPMSTIHSPKGWFELGGHVWGHGVMYNQQSSRDHVELHGKSCVVAHNHKLTRQPGRVMREYSGFSVGCLCNKPAMDYARHRRETASWQNGWLFGEVAEDDAWLYLHQATTTRPDPVEKIALATL